MASSYVQSLLGISMGQKALAGVWQLPLFPPLGFQLCSVDVVFVRGCRAPAGLVVTSWSNHSLPGNFYELHNYIGGYGGTLLVMGLFHHGPWGPSPIGLGESGVHQSACTVQSQNFCRLIKMSLSNMELSCFAFYIL